MLRRATFDAKEIWGTPSGELIYDDENIALWVGTNPAEITRVCDLRARLAWFAEVPDEICVRLERDRDRRPAPTPLQREMSELIGSWSAAGESEAR